MCVCVRVCVRLISDIFTSLLAEAVDFDPMTAPAPVITEDTTRTLEDIIRQRILDQVWPLYMGYGHYIHVLC